MAVNTVLPLQPSWLPMSLVPGKRLSDAEFEELCFSNDMVHFERTHDGEILMHAPTAGGTSNGNFEVLFQLGAWWKTHRRGRVFDSNGGFYLPDGSMLCPDAAYLSAETLKGLSKSELAHFLYRVPDFIVELLSVSDRRSQTEAKMVSWIGNGVKLAWLVDPYAKTATIYSVGQQPVTLGGPFVDGSGPIEGFRLDLQEVWNCFEV